MFSVRGSSRRFPFTYRKKFAGELLNTKFYIRKKDFGAEFVSND